MLCGTAYKRATFQLAPPSRRTPWNTPQVVYRRNSVTITSTPVTHYETAGPVAYRLDWEGLSFTYSGARLGWI